MMDANYQKCKAASRQLLPTATSSLSNTLAPKPTFSDAASARDNPQDTEQCDKTNAMQNGIVTTNNSSSDNSSDHPPSTTNDDSSTTSKMLNGGTAGDQPPTATSGLSSPAEGKRGETAASAMVGKDEGANGELLHGSKVKTSPSGEEAHMPAARMPGPFVSLYISQAVGSGHESGWNEGAADVVAGGPPIPKYRVSAVELLDTGADVSKPAKALVP